LQADSGAANGTVPAAVHEVVMAMVEVVVVVLDFTEEGIVNKIEIGRRDCISIRAGESFTPSRWRGGMTFRGGG
jgi:hypothetical protein